MKSNRDWRNPYYATGIDRILFTVLEIDKRQKHDLPFQDSRPTSLEHNLKGPGHNNLTLIYSKLSQHQNIGDTSPTTMYSSSSTPSSQTGATDSTNTSPTTVQSTSDFSSTPPTSSDSSLQMIRCDQCGRPFTGRFRSLNLQRHQRTAKIHNSFAAFECLQEGCDKKFSRSDNRKDHFRKMHRQYGHAAAKRRAASGGS